MVPFDRIDFECHLWFHKSYEECSDEERLFAEEMAYEYCGG